MTYQLGVDLGTAYTAAAILRDGRAEMVSLGTRAASVPSVLYLQEDGSFLVGDAAVRRRSTDPTRVVSEFKRRFGDPTPIVVGGAPFAADLLMSGLLRWVVDAVAATEGERPERVAVTHPANWGPYKQDLLAQAIRQADVGECTTVTEPEAAAISYSSRERVELGKIVAVYDLGGGTFDAAVLTRTLEGFAILGRPEGIERVGGIDFDEAVFSHVATALGDEISQLDPDDPSAVAAVLRLREECTEAKEALSADTDVTIPVMLSNRSEVRLTRVEFEVMVRPTIFPTVEALARTIVSAGLTPEDVEAVLLVGGSSRIPLVGQLVAAALNRPIAIDAHPKHAVALGAAIAAGGDRSSSAQPDAAGVPTAPESAPAPPTPPPSQADPAAATLPPPISVPSPGAAATSGIRGLARNRLIAAAGVLIVAALAVVLLSRGGGDGSGNAPGGVASDPSVEIAAQRLLTRVLVSQREYVRRTGRWADASATDFNAVGITLTSDRNLASDRVSVDVTAGVLTLGVQAANRACEFLRATSLNDVQTARSAPPKSGRCTLDNVGFSGQQWPLPST